MLNSNSKTDKTPLLILYTGDGKGKTSAALGLLFRSLGHLARCAVIQFIKAPQVATGEQLLAKKLGLQWENYGSGFLFTAEDVKRDTPLFAAGWARAQDLMLNERYDVVILDDITYVLNNGALDEQEVLHWLNEFKKRPKRPHVVLTGRNASNALIDICDMVNVVEELKHPWKSSIAAQKLIEY